VVLVLVLVLDEPPVPAVPAAMLVVGCGVALAEGLGTEVLGLLLASAVDASLPHPQLFQLSQLFELPALGQPQPVPVRQPLDEQTARPTSNAPQINDRESDTFIGRASLRLPRGTSLSRREIPSAITAAMAR
jgi:hypothetical protein